MLNSSHQLERFKGEREAVVRQGERASNPTHLFENGRRMKDSSPLRRRGIRALRRAALDGIPLAEDLIVKELERDGEWGLARSHFLIKGLLPIRSLWPEIPIAESLTAFLDA
jgi:hypothetical protein